MNNFICRIFFDKNTRKCLYANTMSGDINIKTPEEDAAFYLPDTSFDNIVIKEIPNTDVLTLQNLSSCYGVSLNESGELVFNFNPPEEGI